MSTLRPNERDRSSSRQIWCPSCQTFQPLNDEGGPHQDPLNEWPWHDLVCGTCGWIAATIRIMGRDEPD